MKVLVLGDGLLGGEIVKQTGWDYISRKKDGFDINTSEFRFISYDTVVNCIAFTDTYSDNRDQHLDTNYKAVIRLTNYCSDNNIKLVHISTDYVYTNSIPDAKETDVPIHGNNWYSYSKLLGDSYVQLNPNNLVLRGTHKARPFLHPLSWINQIGNFDYVDVIANLYVKLINKKATGVYNVGTDLKTISHLAAQTNPNVKPVQVNTLQVPANLSINTVKLTELLNE